MDWYCALTEHLLRKENIAIRNESYAAVVEVLEKEITALYKSLIHYQMNNICSYYRNQDIFLLGGLVTLDDWENSLEDVKRAEATIEHLSVRYHREYEKSSLRRLFSSGGTMVKVASIRLAHGDYTIGWICMSPKEHSAAFYMLDNVHENLPSSSDDRNAYILGSIGKHNIVIAGTHNWHITGYISSVVAIRMMMTFPNIKASLMVGIGGGVPPDVRLGDIVVGCPRNGDPGFIKWNISKEEWGGEIKRTSQLNDPPAALLTALTTLETNPTRSRAKIADYLEDLKHKGFVPKGYIKSDTLVDVLYKSNYTHDVKSHSTNDDDNPWGKDIEEGVVNPCQLCDPRMIIERPPRENPMIHYGLIASGNQVIKDATLRNKLKRDLDGNVLCIETEAAGLMESYPCIVIRGICDYADSHKNEVWQEYAAATAAAYAKALLSVLPVSDIDGMQPIKGKQSLHVYTEDLRLIDLDILQTSNKLLQALIDGKKKEVSSVSGVS
jgi:nucleoside phosphorylase